MTCCILHRVFLLYSVASCTGYMEAIFRNSEHEHRQIGTFLDLRSVIYSGTQLELGHMFLDGGDLEGFREFGMPRLSGVMQVFGVGLIGVISCLDVELSDYMDNLKAKIQDTFGIIPDLYCWHFAFRGQAMPARQCGPRRHHHGGVLSVALG
eukprot:108613-Alexandrium_andersonii.AAC.1